MYKYEELLVQLRNGESKPSEEEIKEAVDGIRKRIDGLLVDLEKREYFPDKRRIMDEIMILSKRLGDLDSLNKARILYEIELEHKKNFDKVWDLFKKPE